MLLLMTSHADCFILQTQPSPPFADAEPRNGATIHYDEPVIWPKCFRSEVSKLLQS
jgi:hypothetical protein